VSTPKTSASASEDAAQPLREAAARRTARACANAVDLALYRAIRGLAVQPGGVHAIRSFSSLGEHSLLWLGIGAAGVLVDRPRRARWRRALLTVLGSHALSTAIKLTVRRRRPAVEDLPHLMGTPTGLSFPSSHATGSFAAARAYGRLLPAPLLYAVAVPMALSRLYLGVHYPSDVAAGAALGTVTGSLGR
jgi:undecaprenyl-diphosphatase